MKENYTIDELREFFTNQKDFPKYLNTKHSIVKNVSQCAANYLLVIDELMRLHGRPRKEGNPTEKNAWNIMVTKKNRLVDIMVSLGKKSNWLEKLPNELI